MLCKQLRFGGSTNFVSKRKILFLEGKEEDTLPRRRYGLYIRHILFFFFVYETLVGIDILALSFVQHTCSTE
jgi:hypothetical protein